MNPLTHFNCSNCKMLYKLIHKNGYFCTGLVKDYFKADRFRICGKREGELAGDWGLDLKRIEVKELIELLSNLLKAEVV